MSGKRRKADKTSREPASARSMRARGVLASNEKVEGGTARQNKGMGYSLCGVVGVLMVAALVLFQGGYYAGATCAIACVAIVAYAIACAVRKEWRVPSKTSLLLLCVACVFLLSTGVHGFAVTMLQESMMWFAVAGMSLWCAFDSLGEKRKSLELLCIVGAILAGIGLVMFVGVIPVEGTVNAGRLMFTFQYANTAGLFFAVICILCLCTDRKAVRVVSVVPFAALCLTQSVGALIVFALALLVLGWWKLRDGQIKPVVFAGGSVAAVAIVVGAAFVLRDRFAQAAQTFIERVIQVLDGATLFGTHPLLGIGPDQWQFMCSSVQTAQYRAANVHCSYMQIALDGGVLALLAIAVLVGFGMWSLLKAGDKAAALCAGMVTLHALVDFDLQFSSVLVLLALLLAPTGELGTAGGLLKRAGEGKRFAADDERNDAVAALSHEGGSSEQGNERSHRKAPLIGCAAMLVCTMAASAFGVYLDMRAGDVQTAFAQADAAAARQAFSSAPYLERDPLMSVYATGAAYRAGEFEQVVALSADMPRTLENVSLYRVLSLYQLGEYESARQELTSVLHGNPYNVELYRAVRQFVEGERAEAELVAVYNEGCSFANSLITQGHAAWLSGQVRMEEVR